MVVLIPPLHFLVPCFLYTCVFVPEHLVLHISVLTFHLEFSGPTFSIRALKHFLPKIHHAFGWRCGVVVNIVWRMN